MRRTGTLLLFCEDMGFKGCLSDREEGFVAFRTATTLYGLYDALEAGLKGGELDWRESKWKKKS